ncbi:MAG: glycine--tRNA ligase subunit beta, partial [Candidatus Macondimonas sp.]
AGDALPTTLTGCVLGLADRIDTLVGIFGIGQPPTGSKDPFGLRRAAIGVLRILIERGLELDLRLTLNQARAGYGSLKQEPVDAVRAYILERLRAVYEDQNIPAEVFLAVMARDPATVLDFDRRVQAVDHFRRLPEAAALAAAQKRVANILAKAQADATPAAVDRALLQEPAEQALFEALVLKRAATQLRQGDYTAVLSDLAALRAPVDAFFDTVLVNTEDRALRANRLALLAQLRALFWEVADIAQLPAAK